MGQNYYVILNNQKNRNIFYFLFFLSNIVGLITQVDFL